MVENRFRTNMCKCRGEMGLYNRFCERFFAAVIIRLTAQSDSRAPVPGTSIAPPYSCRRSWFLGRGARGRR